MDNLDSSDIAFRHMKSLQQSLQMNHHDLVASGTAMVFNRDALNGDAMNVLCGTQFTAGRLRINDFEQSLCSLPSSSTPGRYSFRSPSSLYASASASASMIKTEDPFLHPIANILPGSSPGGGAGEPFIFHGFPAVAGNFTAMLNEGDNSAGLVSGSMCGLPNIQTMMHHVGGHHQHSQGGVPFQLASPPSINMAAYHPGGISNQPTYISGSPSYLHGFALDMASNGAAFKNEICPSVNNRTNMAQYLPLPNSTTNVPSCEEHCRTRHSGKLRITTRARNIPSSTGTVSNKASIVSSSNLKSNEPVTSPHVCSISSSVPSQTFTNSENSISCRTKVSAAASNSCDVGNAKTANSVSTCGKENQVIIDQNRGKIEATLEHGHTSQHVGEADHVGGIINTGLVLLTGECDRMTAEKIADRDGVRAASINGSHDNDNLNTSGEDLDRWPVVDFDGSIADPLTDGSAAMINSRMFSDKLDVSVHVEDCQCIIVDGTKRWRCLQCPKMYSTKHNLIIHILGHSGIKPHCCIICGKYFKQISHLQTHMLTHGNVRPHVCYICKRTFTQASHVKRHMAIHMEKHPRICARCNQSFACTSELKDHMEQHKEDEKDVDTECVCEECGVPFEGMDQLRKHKATDHHGGSGMIGTLACKVCEKAFMYPSQLRDHAAKHEGTRPYICGECGMNFMKEHHLKSHMFTHTGLRPFQCQECMKAFNQKANLQRHLLVHNGVKRFACEICGRGFTQHQILRAHLITHQETKPFQCKVCGKGFSRLHNLNGHMHMHEGGKPFSCTCGAAFTLKGNLNRHKRDKHGLVVDGGDGEGEGEELEETCIDKGQLPKSDQDARTVEGRTDSIGAHTNYDDIQSEDIINSGEKSTIILTEVDDRTTYNHTSPTRTVDVIDDSNNSVTPKKKRKSMPRKSTLSGTTDGDEADAEVKAAWQLTSEDSLFEEGDDGEDVREIMMLTDKCDVGQMMCMSPSSSCVTDDVNEKLLCTLHAVSTKLTTDSTAESELNVSVTQATHSLISDIATPIVKIGSSVVNNAPPEKSIKKRANNLNAASPVVADCNEPSDKRRRLRSASRMIKSQALDSILASRLDSKQR